MEIGVSEELDGGGERSEGLAVVGGLFEELDVVGSRVASPADSVRQPPMTVERAIPVVARTFRRNISRS